jgi:hypothetical protein
MATKYTCKECGCKDSFLVSPAPCPTPGGCPDPEPCSEVINAECVVYTGLDIECDDDIVVETDTTLADALVDIVYVAMGTAYMMGLPWQQLWDEVQRSNMDKVRASDASQSKRKNSLDVVKPQGWVGPDLKSIIESV